MSLASLILLLSAACGGRGEASPTAAPSPATTGTAAAAPGATSTPPPATVTLEGRLREIEDRVIAIRGLSRPEDVPKRFVDPAQMQALIDEELADPETVEDFDNAEHLYKLLGLIPQGSRLVDLYRTLLGAQVLGLYDDKKKEFFVLQSGADVGASEESTYAHEYVHRLQDAHFDLTALLASSKGADPASGAGRSDRESAISALVEGDAVNAQSVYTLRHISFARMADMLREAADAERLTADIPYVLHKGLEFPYVAGPSFVTALQLKGGQARLDAAFKSPPVTTEQVIHPEKFLAGEGPVAVKVPGDAVLGPGWKPVHADSFGEFFLRTWLEAEGAGAASSTAAAGWGGDAFRLYASADGTYALAGVIVWDGGRADATEFFNAMSDALGKQQAFRKVALPAGGPVSLWSGPGGVLALALAEAPALLGTATVIVIAPDANLAVNAFGALASGG